MEPSTAYAQPSFAVPQQLLRTTPGGTVRLAWPFTAATPFKPTSTSLSSPSSSTKPTCSAAIPFKPTSTALSSASSSSKPTCSPAVLWEDRRLRVKKPSKKPTPSSQSKHLLVRDRLLNWKKLEEEDKMLREMVRQTMETCRGRSGVLFEG